MIYFFSFFYCIIRIWTISINSDTHKGDLELYFLSSLSSRRFVLALFLLKLLGSCS